MLWNASYLQPIAALAYEQMGVSVWSLQFLFVYMCVEEYVLNTWNIKGSVVFVTLIQDLVWFININFLALFT